MSVRTCVCAKGCYVYKCLFVGVFARTIVCAYIDCWHKSVFLHAIVRRVVYVYKCLFVEIHARTIICAYIDCWPTCVFVHAFARRLFTCTSVCS